MSAERISGTILVSTEGSYMRFDDPAFWRAGAISTVAIMSVVLIMLTIDSLAVISPGGANVPPYTVINRHIDYKFDAKRGNDVPAIGAPQPLFGKSLDADEAAKLIDKGKMDTESCLHQLPYLLR